jgi:CBS domain-containing protein/nucleotide-binding universal stress UspA family protein
MTTMTETRTDGFVVGIDYSGDSVVALRQACELARRSGHPILAVHAIASDVQFVDTSDIWRSGEDSTRREQDRLEQHLAAFAATANLQMRVAWGEPARCLARIASETGATLIFVGRAGTTGGEADTIGRVARTLLAVASCPVVVCAAAPAAAAARPVGATVADIMHADPATISQSDTLVEAQRRMAAAGVHQLPVVADGTLIGIVSLVDLERQTGYLDRTKVDAVMTGSPVTVSADAPVTAAIGILLDENINALPVLRGDRLVGIVSRTDILRLAARLGS